MEKMIRILLLIISLLLLLFVFFIGPWNVRMSTRGERTRAWISSLRAVAEDIYEKEGSYSNVRCDYQGEEGYMIEICDGLESLDKKLIIHQSEKEYCAYLYNQNRDYHGYLCLDDQTNSVIRTYINPGEEGYCDSLTFKCPTKRGIPSIQQIKEIKDNLTIYDYLTVLGVLGVMTSLIWSIILFVFKRKKSKEVIK